MSLFDRLRYKVVAILLSVFVRPSGGHEMLRIGTSYGGWWVPRAALNEKSICYLVGAGEDVSFDLGLIEEFGSHIVCLDPTPRAISYVGSLSVPPQFHFVPVGVGGTNRTAKFFAPANPSHVSHSVANVQRTDQYFEAELRTVSTLMKLHGHPQIDLLKLDIEGAEFEVIDSVVAEGVEPPVFLIEFDDPRRFLRTLWTIRSLKAIGYRVMNVEGFNISLFKPFNTNSARPPNNERDE